MAQGLPGQCGRRQRIGGDRHPTCNAGERFSLVRSLHATFFEGSNEPRQQVNSISEDQQRVRENMKALKGSAEEKALVERYVRELNRQEDHVQALRREITELPAAEQRFRDRSGNLKVLVVGGSLGAQILNDTVPRALALIPETRRPDVTTTTGAATWGERVLATVILACSLVGLAMKVNTTWLILGAGLVGAALHSAVS